MTATGRITAKPKKTAAGVLTIVLERDGASAIKVMADPSSRIAVASLKVGSTYRVVGFVGQRATRSGALDGYRVWVRDAADLAIVAGPTATPSPAGGPGSPKSSPGAGSPAAMSIARALTITDRDVAIDAIVTVPCQPARFDPSPDRGPGRIGRGRGPPADRHDRTPGRDQGPCDRSDRRRVRRPEAASRSTHHLGQRSSAGCGGPPRATRGRARVASRGDHRSSRQRPQARRPMARRSRDRQPEGGRRRGGRSRHRQLGPRRWSQRDRRRDRATPIPERHRSSLRGHAPVPGRRPCRRQACRRSRRRHGLDTGWRHQPSQRRLGGRRRVCGAIGSRRRSGRPRRSRRPDRVDGPRRRPRGRPASRRLHARRRHGHRTRDPAWFRSRRTAADRARRCPRGDRARRTVDRTEWRRWSSTTRQGSSRRATRPATAASPSASAGPLAGDLAASPRPSRAAGWPVSGVASFPLDPGAAGLGTLLAISAASLAITVLRRQQLRRRMTARIATRLATLAGPSTDPPEPPLAERGPRTIHSA